MALSRFTRVDPPSHATCHGCYAFLQSIQANGPTAEAFYTLAFCKGSKPPSPSLLRLVKRPLTYAFHFVRAMLSSFYRQKSLARVCSVSDPRPLVFFRKNQDLVLTKQHPRYRSTMPDMPGHKQSALAPPPRVVVPWHVLTRAKLIWPVLLLGQFIYLGTKTQAATGDYSIPRHFIGEWLQSGFSHFTIVPDKDLNQQDNLASTSSNTADASQFLEPGTILFLVVFVYLHYSLYHQTHLNQSLLDLFLSLACPR